MLDKTEKEEIKWSYNDDESVVDLETKKFKITIRYKFDYDQEIGTYRIDYTRVMPKSGV